MPFLQAIFCLKGFDDRSRFFSISIVTLLIFILFSTVFSAYIVLSFAILVLLTIILSCSTIRRLHDAQLTKNWQLVPSGLFFLIGVLCLLIESNSSYYLLVLPIVSIGLLLTYPSKNQKPKKDYILGYYGPVDLHLYRQTPVTEKTHNQRIEPTLAANGSSEQLAINENVVTQNITDNEQSDNETDKKQADIGELIRLKLLSNRKFQFGIMASILLIFIAVFVNNASQHPNEPSASTDLSEQQILPKNTQATIITNRSHLLSMPDHFNVYLSEYKGIIIHWQADQVADGEFWSLASAKGDKSCQSMSFNKGATIRPLAVLIEKGSEYFASFSPLDSKELARALAFKSKFTLCGYSFSLKGTQALLGKHSQYAPFLETDS
ncbi:MAG: DUF805 domain-containing protein [Colwellia sp.]